MQLASTPAKLTARAAQRLQACIHAVELALRELDRIGLSFESGILGGLCPGASKLKCKSGASLGSTLSARKLQKTSWQGSRASAPTCAKQCERIARQLRMQQSGRSDLSRRCPCRFTQCKEILVEVVYTVCLLKLVYGPCGQRM